jgi:hypothetical protein
MLAVLLLPLARGAAAVPCVGDCDGDCRVTIDEIMGAICIHNLAATWCRECEAMDANCSGTIAINELIQGVNNALNGCPAPCVPGGSHCPAPAPSATATPPPSATATATPTSTPEPPDPLGGVVDELLHGDSRCAQLWVSASTGYLNVHCAYGPGHDTDVTFARLASATDAAAAVAPFAEIGGAIEFRDAPAYAWEAQFPQGSLEFNYRYFGGQLDCWFISGQSFDDTSYRLAYHPVELSEAIAESIAGELLARCE